MNKKEQLTEEEKELYNAYWKWVSKYNGLTRMDYRVRVLRPNELINMIKGVNGINY